MLPVSVGVGACAPPPGLPRLPRARLPAPPPPPRLAQGPSPQPHLPPQAGYSPYAPQLGAAQQYMPQTGPQMAMAYLPSIAGQVRASRRASRNAFFSRFFGAAPATAPLPQLNELYVRHVTRRASRPAPPLPLLAGTRGL